MMQVADKVTVTRAAWQQQGEQSRAIRYKVFVEEQKVPKAMEVDDQDAAAEHFLVRHENKLVATGRLTTDGQIGRMAVLPAFRNQGIGSRLLKTMLEYARERNLKRVYLHAQIRAIPFYNRHGFHACGETFMEAGIAHRRMERPCND